MLAAWVCMVDSPRRLKRLLASRRKPASELGHVTHAPSCFGRRALRDHLGEPLTRQFITDLAQALSIATALVGLRPTKSDPVARQCLGGTCRISREEGVTVA